MAAFIFAARLARKCSEGPASAVFFECCVSEISTQATFLLSFFSVHESKEGLEKRTLLWPV
ncbi:hypothetical protein C8N30_1447 [Sulfitobacter guttiformis]|uniref:Uncharacterized protein n=1 Tax=Sulfitobacter guttiformis TaxID=74349 RepID=A0A420DRB6_9RHOB|nr:hypothetical protein C8N30_1447 [Sulfitobacter guttiformis]